jgi:hypothetical protein
MHKNTKEERATLATSVVHTSIKEKRRKRREKHHD